MDSRKFDVDFWGISTRLIVSVVVEGIVIGVLFGGFAWFLLRGLIPEGTLLDVAVVVFGVLEAHFILSLIFTIVSLRKAIKSFTVTDKSFEINGISFGSAFDPDNFRGTGLNYDAGIMAFVVPAIGVSLRVLSSDESGKPVRKIFWTGPLFDKEAKKLRSDINEFLVPSVKALTDARYEEVAKTVKTKPVKVRFNKKKYKKDKVLYSIVIALVVLAFIGVAILNISSLPVAIVSVACAGLVTGYWATLVAKNQANIVNMPDTIELTDDYLKVDDNVFELEKLETDLFHVGRADPKTEGSIKSVPPEDRTSMGIYLKVNDSNMSNRYWLGAQLDSEAAAAVLLIKYANRLKDAKVQ